MLHNPKWQDFPPAVEEEEPWRKILRDAAKLLREHGHCQNMFVDPHGRICMAAALTTAAGLGRLTFWTEPRMVFCAPVTPGVKRAMRPIASEIKIEKVRLSDNRSIGNILECSVTLTAAPTLLRLAQ